MVFLRTYSTPDGETHLEERELPLEATGSGDWRFMLNPAAPAYLRKTPARQVVDWHPAPRRQYIIPMAGEVEVEVSDGTIRRFGVGTLMLVEDVTGKGHITRSIGNEERVSLFIPVDE